MFDYLEMEAFGPGELLDLYTSFSPVPGLDGHEQDLVAFFPELLEADWREHRCSQCRSTNTPHLQNKLASTRPGHAYTFFYIVLD